MKLLNYKISAQQVEATQSRRFSLGQYMVAVSVLLLSVTAISYAAGLLTLKSFNAGAPISSTDVNANFQSINDTLAAMTAAISNVQATAASDATTKAAAAQSAAIAQAANLYQPKFGTAGWADVTLSRGAGTIFHNTGTPRFVLIYHGSGGVTFTSSSASDLSGSVVIGPDVSANGATQTVSGSFVVPPNYYYRIDGTVLNWYEYAL